MKIAIMTGGGDCPGLNAIIQAIVTRAFEYGYETVGVLDGYSGLLNEKIIPLTLGNVEDIYATGGTILYSSRTNPFKTNEGPRKVLDTIQKFGLDALIIIGGDDTLGVANKLHGIGIPIVGIPKTVDNDLPLTDYCIGFQTSVETASEAISKLHSTAKSHKRVIIAEVMGRYVGWLTLMAGLAGGAHVILIPEKPFDIKEVIDVIRRRDEAGKGYTIIAVAEGAKPIHADDLIVLGQEKDEFGHCRLGGIGQILEKEIGQRTGKETRTTVLGHIQRGGPPNAFDKIYGIRLGLFAVDLVKQGKFGYAAIINGTKIDAVKLGDLMPLKVVTENFFELTKFFSTG
ncbi:MAG: ATP-dependent 6-phosphofructokinase [Candidatus Bathyarchaeota archaeon]